MAILRWLNGWKLMAIAAFTGYLVVATEALLYSERKFQDCLRWRSDGIGLSGSENVELALVGACALLMLAGLIWGLVSLFVSIEQRRSR